MRYIRKTEEPEAFRAWKQQANENWIPSWSALDSDRTIKNALHHALLEEQGFVCCYCNQRIYRLSSHIEHLQPRESFPDLELEHSNLLASCPGYPEDQAPSTTNTSRKRSSCGHKKGKWYAADQMVSPLIANCADFFVYLATGQIQAIKHQKMEPAAQTTIQRLGLNSKELTIAREGAIDGALQDIEQLTQEEILQLIQGYNQPDPNTGELAAYCSAIVYQLKQFLNP